MTPLAILLERAEVAMLMHGPAAQGEMLRQIEAAVRNGDDPGKVRDLDHVLQLVEYRERIASARLAGGLHGLGFPLSGLGAKPPGC
ncbi:hypothetical protein IAG41_11625 [Sphingomonas sp. JC676]|uniref:hypothetical protein n=1 Tax=Sphingomonas sp. JC676 TaxID=2768065 RepID=UPI0016578D80|nr:hypothetical protein [Sphingomonas sp. JC676]MBC9033045.1 hypothetical protein [Sphingomonas sp. JC676]